MAVTEKDIQLHIWGLKNKWTSIIEPVSFPDPVSFAEDENDIWALTPQAVLLNRVNERLADMDGYVRDATLMGCEVGLKKDGDSTIRADLMCASAGRAGFGVIEIKKSAQTERQAYTELLGYGNHIQALFPGMSTEDLAYILISPMEERIVREATLLSLLLDEKPVYCLVPSWSNDDVTTLKLTPWIPEEKDLANISEAMFHPSNIEIFKLTWPPIEDWNCEEPGEDPKQYMIDTMNKMSIYAAQLMEAKHIAGFAFSAQMWSEIPIPHPNSLIVAGINPYGVSKTLYMMENGADVHKIGDNWGDDIKMEDILPQIKNTHNPAPEHDFMEWLSIGWGNTITGIALDAFHVMTTNSNGDRYPTDHGSMTWKQYRDKLGEDTHSHIYDIRPTGLLRKLFMGYQKEDYAYLTKHGYEKHPTLHHGDIPAYSIDNWYKQFFFRDFLDRLFDPFKEWREMAEYDRLDADESENRDV